MNLLDEKIKKVYFKCLLAAFGSAMISCIYGVVDMAVVDMAVVGQYQGPNGTPLWPLLLLYGILFIVLDYLWALVVVLFLVFIVVKIVKM